MSYMTYMMPSVLGIITFYIFSIALTNSESLVSVNVTNGTLIGSETSFQVTIFSGIPYAAPPTGDLRFESPQPANWSGLLNVSIYNQAIFCPQILPVFNIYKGKEDCLVLHVLTPNVSGNLPVVVWIHGGAYVFGSGDQFPLVGLAENLAKRGVVVVAINYRLNVLGFFTSQTTEFPGNMGMLDQVQALRWVQAEIRNFGGDPDQVTIMGQSAGSSSVSLLTYSPLAKGLFKQAIMESGTAYAQWAFNGVRGFYDDTSGKLAVKVNCTTEEEWQSGQSYQKIVQCLKNKTELELINAAHGGVIFILNTNFFYVSLLRYNILHC